VPGTNTAIGCRAYGTNALKGRFFVAKIGETACPMRLLRRFHLRNDTGRKGEDTATRYLKRNGWKILERNYRNLSGKSLGEIDIIAKDGDEIVFVEVKARTTAGSEEDILPESAITTEKLRRLSRIGESYMIERGNRDCPYRFDAIAIRLFEDGREPDVRHIRSIFL